MGGGMLWFVLFMAGSVIMFWLGTELAKMFPLESNLWGYLVLPVGIVWVVLALSVLAASPTMGALAGGGGIHP